MQQDASVFAAWLWRINILGAPSTHLEGATPPTSVAHLLIFAGRVWNPFLQLIPSGYVKIAIENPPIL